MHTMNRSKIENQMNNDTLESLEKIFYEADKGGGGRLQKLEFEEAIKMAFKHDMEFDDADLEFLFMKVDTDCDGTVDWEEFCSYMLLENQHKDKMINDTTDVPFPHEAREIYRLRNDSFIAKIIYFPTLSKQENYDEEVCNNPGHYISCSKDGTLIFWGLDFHIQRTVNLGEQNNEEKVPAHPIWITDMVCLYKAKKVVIATTDRDISFYEICSKNLRKKVSITGLSHCVQCMDYWQNPKDTGQSYLLFGDAGGNVTCLTFMQTSTVLFDSNMCSFSSQDSDTVNTVTFEELVSGKQPNINVLVFRNLHSDWVRSVKYVAHLDCFISCSSSLQSLFLGDLYGKRMRAIFKVRKGFYCFDYNKENNIIVTGGLDRNVRLWNPYVPARPISILKGHHTAVHQTVTTGNQIISLSKDNVIMIWNLTEQTCVQTLPHRFLSKDTTPFTTIFYNRKMNIIILGGSTLSVLERYPLATNNKDSKRNKEIKSHAKPVSEALYNELFMIVVSCCLGSVVNVWDIHTGEKVIMFKDAHDGHEITAMSFDVTKRRLITGSRNGTTKIWNFHNGACLRVLGPHDGGEITGILCTKHKIFTVGWNHKIIEYRDIKGGEHLPPRLRNDIHKNDIMASDILTNSNYIATASYDGQVTCWNASSNSINSSINVNKILKKRSVVTALYVNTINQYKLRSTFPYSAPTELITKHVTVDKLFFLQNRKPDRGVAILLIIIGRIIQAWSLYGDLMGQFDASPGSDESILSMASNRYNEILLSGDTSGHIKIWDISNYCTGTNKTNFQQRQQRRRDSILDLFNSTDDIHSFMTTSVTATDTTSTVDSICSPPQCLRSYQGHCSSIVSIDYIEDKQLILTASTDCSVRLWTLDGQYIGTFGQSSPWNLYNDSPLQCNKAPTTLLRVASDQTLNVLNGETPQWKLENNEFPLLEGGKNIFSVGNEETNFNNSESDSELNEEEVFDISLTNILGKNYKTKQRYKCPPTIKPKLKDEQCVAFSNLPFTELVPITCHKRPSVIGRCKEVKIINEVNLNSRKPLAAKNIAFHRSLSRAQSLPDVINLKK